MPRASTIFVLHLSATVFMTGVIWVIQLIHYPLFARVGQEGYVAYQSEHEKRITWIVGPMMLLELATGALLLVNRPAAMPRTILVLNLALLGVIWLSTAFLQVPQHRRLESGYDAVAISRLVQTNWIRTVSWSARSIMLICVLLRAVF